MIFKIFTFILSIIVEVPSFSYVTGFPINHNPQSLRPQQIQNPRHRLSRHPTQATTNPEFHIRINNSVTQFRSHPHRSIREYLSEKRRKLRIFSIGQIIGGTVYECDFSDRIDGLEGVVAVDLDERFAVWKLGIAQSMAIKPAGVWELLDGMIVY